MMTRDIITTGHLWKKALLTVAGIAAFIVPVAVLAQNPPPQARDLPPAAALPSFEEASIRPNTTEGRGGRGGQFQPTRWVSQNVTLKTILKNTFARQGAGGPNTALPLLDSQVIGGPDWLDADKFDIVATTPASTQPTPPPQARQMALRMLLERFKLKAHWETRELPVYVLSKARADGSLGPGLTPTPDAECEKARAAGPPPMPQAAPPGQTPPSMPPPNCGGVQFGPGQLIARGAPMEMLVQTLTSVPVVTGIDRPVIDRSGLQGNYGFALKFAPAGAANADADRPELVTALREQLGLKLEASRAPVEVLVIDSVDRPTAN
jgi:uncharacterized protein (TIGR03435 family)